MMLSHNTHNREIDKYYKIIKDAKVEIDKIRDNCVHSDCKDGYYEWRIGSIQWKRICKKCDAVVGEALSKDPGF